MVESVAPGISVNEKNILVVLDIAVIPEHLVISTQFTHTLICECSVFIMLK